MTRLVEQGLELLDADRALDRAARRGVADQAIGAALAGQHQLRRPRARTALGAARYVDAAPPAANRRDGRKPPRVATGIDAARPAIWRAGAGLDLQHGIVL